MHNPKKIKGVVFLGFYSRVTVEQLEQLELKTNENILSIRSVSNTTCLLINITGWFPFHGMSAGCKLGFLYLLFCFGQSLSVAAIWSFPQLYYREMLRGGHLKRFKYRKLYNAQRLWNHLLTPKICWHANMRADKSWVIICKAVLFCFAFKSILIPWYNLEYSNAHNELPS